MLLAKSSERSFSNFFKFLEKTGKPKRPKTIEIKRFQRTINIRNNLNQEGAE